MSYLFFWLYEPLMWCKESRCLNKMNRWSPPWYNPERLRRQAYLQQLGHTALHYVNTQNGWPDMIWYSHWEDVYSQETNQCEAWLSVISTHSFTLFYNANGNGERMRFFSPFNTSRHIILILNVFVSGNFGCVAWLFSWWMEAYNPKPGQNHCIPLCIRVELKQMIEWKLRSHHSHTGWHTGWPLGQCGLEFHMHACS